ncbi:MAG TPA: pyridoxamine 5'-phosphate oxidase family protein [Thermoanaerobaculia bacterium]|nr:pyridoxamine 5'-phosphate oxidase family protein [Thermoanaerobaculia bacterium]
MIMGPVTENMGAAANKTYDAIPEPKARQIGALMEYRHMDLGEMEKLLHEQRLARIAFSNNGNMYIIPLGYVWADGELLIMTSAGQKTDMAAHSPHVAFQVDDFPQTGMLGWSSVSGEGDWHVVDDEAGKGRVAGAVMSRFGDLGNWINQHPAARPGPPMVFVRIKPRWMTGRAFPNG